MKNLILITSLLISTSYANAWVFSKNKGKGTVDIDNLNDNVPVCVYIENGYRPVTSIIAKVADELTPNNCSEKVINQFLKRDIQVIKIKKSQVSPSQYAKLIKAYYSNK